MSSAAEGAPEDADAISTVITPARLKQSLQDVPASVTVITAEQLRLLNIEHIWDALRLVPGMEVTQSTGNLVILNYHGTNIRNPRRMNVLIDGISVYRPGFSEIHWTHLPVTVEDVERIEVTRGPNSATYGPNSMMAVVNIITKHPRDVPRGSLTAMGAEGGEYRTHVRLATVLGNTALHIAASADGAEGFDVVDGIRPGHDTTRAKRLLIRSHTSLSDSQSLGFEFTHLDGKSENPFRGQYEREYFDKYLRDFYAAGTWKASRSPQHELQVQLTYSSNRTDQRWTVCYPTLAFLPELGAIWRANPAYAAALILGQAPRGGTPADSLLAMQAITAIQRLGPRAMAPLCGVVNQDAIEKRADIEIQQTLVASEQLRLVGGLGARRQSLDSQTFLGGKRSNDLYRAFGNLEYKPVKWMNFNVGVYAEHDDLVGWSTAPRAAFNFHIAPNQTLRLLASRGLRTPDVIEQRGNFSYTLRSSIPGPTGTFTPIFFQTAQSSGGLRSEVADSREIGYMVNLPRHGLTLDVRLFDEHLKHLISEVVELASFNPTNKSSVRLRGAEFQARFTITPAWTSFVSYAYLENRKASNPFERTQYSRHSGAIGVNYSHPVGWRASAAYFGSSGDGIGESRFGRTDFVVGRRIALGSRIVEASAFVRRYDTSFVSYVINRGRARSSERDDQIQFGAKLSVAF